MEVKIYLQRFVDLGKELKMKNLTVERRDQCKANYDAFKSKIMGQLTKKNRNENVVENVVHVDDHEKEALSEHFKTAMSEFECPVCLDIMSSPIRIYSCSNDHFICSKCLTKPKLTTCPQCREDFKIHKPNIRHTSERFLAMLLLKQQ